MSLIVVVYCSIQSVFLSLVYFDVYTHVWCSFIKRQMFATLSIKTLDTQQQPFETIRMHACMHACIHATLHGLLSLFLFINYWSFRLLTARHEVYYYYYSRILLAVCQGSVKYHLGERKYIFRISLYTCVYILYHLRACMQCMHAASYDGLLSSIS